MTTAVLEQPLRTRADILAEVREVERQIATLRAKQVVLLRELSRGSVAWREDPGALARELDVARSTAEALMETAWRTPELSDRMAELASGTATFDRAHALAKLVAADAEPAAFEEARHRDVGGVARLASEARRVRRRDERQAHGERHVRSWPSLDRAAGFLSAQLAGTDWQIVDTALNQRADEAPPTTGTREQRRADALVALAQDWLDGRRPAGSGAVPTVTIVVDADKAAATDGEVGVGLTSGPRVGPDTLDEIMCSGAVEVMIAGDGGVPLAVGPTARVIPPKVRRLVLSRDRGCTIDGCSNRYRLEVHHIVPRSRGGTHDLENLTTLCWYHHHVEVHRSGNMIDPDSPPRRRRIIPEAER